MKEPWGRGELMAMAAVRYCLGRRSYIVSDCVDWLFDNWNKFGENTRNLIKRDIEEEIKRDEEARVKGHSSRLPWDDCDRNEWLRCRELWDA